MNTIIKQALGIGGFGGGFCIESKNLFSRFTYDPGTERKRLIDSLIRKGKSHGWWQIADLLQIHAAHDSQAALLNWIKDAHNGTLIGTPDFTIDRGFQCSRAGLIETALSATDLNYNPLNDHINYQQNNASFIFGNLSLNAISGSGATSGCAINRATQIAFRTTGTTGFALNGGTTTMPAVTSRKTYVGVIRRNATEIIPVENKTIKTPVVSNSLGYPNGNIYLGSLNTGSATSGGEDRYNFVFIGGALTDIQYQYLIDDIEYYMHEVGAGIIPQTTTLNILDDPYNQVFKVTANQDSVFKFNVNKAFFYSASDIYNVIESIGSKYFDPDIDTYSKIKLWLDSQAGGYKNIGNTTVSRSELLRYFNSYSDSICSGQAQAAINLFNHYYNGLCQVVNKIGEAIVYPHTTFNIDGVAYGDTFTKETLYKGKFQPATMEEVQADLLLNLEPLRKTNPTGHWDVLYTPDWQFETWQRVTPFEVYPLIPELIMKLPSGASFIYPVKSVNSIIGINPGYPDVAMPEEMCNIIATIPTGSIGLVAMPCILTQITGTGSVKVGGNTYNLPTDEAILKTFIQNTPNNMDVSYYEFEVLTNSGGIVAEFLANKKRALLFRKNNVSLEVISGSVSYEPVTTDKPLYYQEVSIYKGNHSKFTLNFQKEFFSNVNVRLPFYSFGSHLHNIRWYGEKRSKTKWFRSLTPEFPEQLNTAYPPPAINGFGIDDYSAKVIPDTPVYGQCWSAKLYPRVTEFSDATLELSFIAIDDSDIYYTLDGSTPDNTKTLYTAPFTISETTTIKWINIKTEYDDSHINSRTITKV